MKRISTSLLLLASIVPSALALRTPQESGEARPEEAQRDEALPASDAEVAAWRIDLLESAYQAASAMPVHPFIKDRSRAQESVVVTCLELDLPVRALRYTEGIENWRRGVGYADFAHYCAERGFLGEVEPYLARAAEVAEGPTGEAEQEWRRNLVLAKVARTRSFLGQGEAVQALVDEIQGSEDADSRTLVADFEGEFDSRIAGLRRVAEVGGFESKQTALGTCLRLYGEVYADRKQRGKVVVTMQDLWGELPVQVRLETLMAMARTSLEQGDAERAIATLDEAQALYDSIPWRAEFGVPWLGELARCYAEAGETEGARRRVEEALATFEREQETILTIDHADALKPLAEALFAAGDRDAALAVYRRVLEEGADNPNARPRAEDLIALCLSLARTGCEPDTALAERIGEVLAGLDAPW